MKTPLFTGCGVAIVTPFTQTGVDYDAFSQLLEWQIDSGTDAIIVCGTTGEASTLTRTERSRLTALCIERVDGRIPVIVGTGSNCTQTTAELSREAESLGADGILVVTPYYNKATQQGLCSHYLTVADSVSIPLILYNVPSRTGVSCSADTYRLLSRHANINGVKEASGNFSLIQETLRQCCDDLFVWSGNDEDTTAVCALGGKGVISVAANIIPRDMHDLTQLCFENDVLAAGEMQVKMSELLRALFCEVNPIPVKTAMWYLGLCSAQLRLPLCEIGPDGAAFLKKAMQRYRITL